VAVKKAAKHFCVDSALVGYTAALHAQYAKVTALIRGVKLIISESHSQFLNKSRLLIPRSLGLGWRRLRKILDDPDIDSGDI
jgi:hypothetical protein